MKNTRQRTVKPSKEQKTGYRSEKSVFVDTYMSIFRELPDIVYKISSKGIFTFINEAVKILGYKPGELIGKHFSTIVHPDDVKLFGRRYVLPRYRGKKTGHANAPMLFDERRTGKRKTRGLEIRLLPKSKKKNNIIFGEVIAFGNVPFSERIGTGRLRHKNRSVGTLGIIRDITQQKERLDKLHYQADMLNHVSDAIISMDLKFHIRTWNRGASKMYGWKAHEVMGKTMAKITKSKYLKDSRKHVIEQFHKHGYWNGELLEKHKKGRIMNVHSSLSVIKDEYGDSVGVIAINRDITDYKKAEQALRESEQKMKNIIEHSHEVYYIHDRKHKLTYISPYCYDLIGYKPEQMPSDWRKLLTDNPINKIGFGITMKALKTGKRQKPYLMEMKGTNGIIKMIEIDESPIKNSRGNVIGLIGAARDVTEKQKIDDALRESEMQYRSTINSMNDAIHVIDKNFRIKLANDVLIKWNKMYKLPVDVIDKYLFDLYTFLPDKVRDEYKNVFKNGKNVVTEERTSLHGRDVFTETRKIPIKENNRTVRVLSIMRDITQQKQAEHALRKSEEKYSTVVESTLDAIIIHQSEAVKFANDAACKMTGYTHREFSKMDISELVAPEYIKLVKKRFASRLIGKKVPSIYEIVIVGKHKKRIPVELNVTIIEYENKPAALIFIRNITERKKAEEKLKKSLQEKNALLKEIHHRVKNNLQIVSSLLNLQSNYVKSRKHKNFFKESQARIKSMVLVHEKLYHSKDLSGIEPSDYFSSLLKYLMQSYGQKPGSIELNMDIDSIAMNIDTAIPCGLIVNELVSNSLKHAFIRMHNRKTSKKPSITVVLKKTGKKDIKFIIMDNGRGMPDNIDFRNTKSLGLQLVCALVDQLGGEIILDKENGTRFMISFPYQR